MIRCMAGALPGKDVLRPKGRRLALRAAIRNLNPGYFALVRIRHALFAACAAPGQRRRHLRGNVPNPASAAVHAAIRNPPLSASTAKASTPALPSATRLRHASEDPAAAASGRPGLAMLAGDVPGRRC